MFFQRLNHQKIHQAALEIIAQDREWIMQAARPEWKTELIANSQAQALVEGLEQTDLKPCAYGLKLVEVLRRGRLDPELEFSDNDGFGNATFGAIANDLRAWLKQRGCQEIS